MLCGPEKAAPKRAWLQLNTCNWQIFNRFSAVAEGNPLNVGDNRHECGAICNYIGAGVSVLSTRHYWHWRLFGWAFALVHERVLSVNVSASKDHVNIWSNDRKTYDSMNLVFWIRVQAGNNHSNGQIPRSGINLCLFGSLSKEIWKSKIYLVVLNCIKVLQPLGRP